MHFEQEAHLHCRLCGYKESVPAEKRIDVTRDHLASCAPSKAKYEEGIEHLRKAEECAAELGGTLGHLIERYQNIRVAEGGGSIYAPSPSSHLEVVANA